VVRLKGVFFIDSYPPLLSLSAKMGGSFDSCRIFQNRVSFNMLGNIDFNRGFIGLLPDFPPVIS
jgi:hypothetical protein